MFDRNELQLLCDTFQKCHVQIRTVTVRELPTLVDELGAQMLSADITETRDALERFFFEAKPQTLYKATDALKRAYLSLLLPDTDPPALLFVGPYLSSKITEREILELGERRGISPKNQRYLSEYYSGLPVLTEDSRLLIMLETFCERIWQTPSFAIVDLGAECLPYEPLSEPLSYGREPIDDSLVNIKAIEKRYEFENEMIEAVSRGQIHKEKLIRAAFSEMMFERRLSDLLRNAKNYGIIMNTLLRKAAEQGGVHPLHLDRASSAFAAKIEQLSAASEISSLMCEMFRSYCHLVRDQTTKGYSPVIRKTVLLIDSDLSADLSLRALSERQNISAGYLSAMFRQETGQTLSEFVRERRIRHAARLLHKTNLQIQTVASHCGIMDVQYFSKLFKKQMGKTPKEYRDEGARR